MMKTDEFERLVDALIASALGEQTQHVDGTAIAEARAAVIEAWEGSTRELDRARAALAALLEQLDLRDTDVRTSGVHVRSLGRFKAAVQRARDLLPKESPDDQ